MGNAQTSYSTYNVNGDGNQFLPNNDMQASAIPTLDLNPGILNPTGIFWKSKTATLSDSSNLVIMKDKNGGQITYLTNDAITTMTKLCGLTNLYNDMFIATGRDYCGPITISQYITKTTGYVGLTQDDALHNYIRDGNSITSKSLIDVRTRLANRLTCVYEWSEDLRTATSLVPMDSPHGSLNGKWKSIIEFLKKTLPPDNICLLYPDEMFRISARLFPAIQPSPNGKTTDKVASGTLAGSLASNTPSAGNIAQLAACGKGMLDKLQTLRLDLLSSDAYLTTDTLKSNAEPKTYVPAEIMDLSTPWITIISTQGTSKYTPFQVKVPITSNSTETYNAMINIPPHSRGTYLTMKYLPDCIINLQLNDVKRQITDATITELFKTNGNGKMRFMAMLIQTEPDIQQVDLTISKVYPLNNVLLQRTATFTVLGPQMYNIAGPQVSFVFEKQQYPSLENVYLWYGLVFQNNPTKDKVTGDNYFLSEFQDARVSINPIDDKELSYKGRPVKRVRARTLIGSYTEDQFASTLPNDVGLILERKSRGLTQALISVEEGPVTNSNPIVGSIVGTLAIDNSYGYSLGQTNHWEKAKRAYNLLLGAPQGILRHAAPVLSDPNVWTSLSNGILTAYRTRNISSGIKSVQESLSNNVSIATFKQSVLDKISRLFPI